MRRAVIVLSAAVVAVGGVWAARAATGGGTTPAKCIDTVWRTDPVSTTSTTFTDVPGMSDGPAAVFPIIVNASAVLTGAPVEFRVKSTNVGDVTEISKPGRASFVPSGGGPDAFSFQWIEKNQSGAVHVNQLQLQWRSPSGNQVTMLRGDLAVDYSTDGCIGQT
ncbi:MAG TPA: hypothetical protein VJ736_02115 [Actinomycetota bacterium]|jgi:hypothetical protein|nr:hypothetical protein [Actinomycetota bacterium]